MGKFNLRVVDMKLFAGVVWRIKQPIKVKLKQLTNLLIQKLQIKSKVKKRTIKSTIDNERKGCFGLDSK